MSIARLGRTQTHSGKHCASTSPPMNLADVQLPASGAHRRADLLTPVAAAELLSVSPKVLERWRGTGDGPAYVKLSSKIIRYRQEDVEAFIAARVRSSTATN